MRTEQVELDLNESSTLCNLLMKVFVSSGGLGKQPEWALVLYEKLAKANDILRGH